MIIVLWCEIYLWGFRGVECKGDDWQRNRLLMFFRAWRLQWVVNRGEGPQRHWMGHLFVGVDFCAYSCFSYTVSIMYLYLFLVLGLSTKSLYKYNNGLNEEIFLGLPMT